ncbi:MAG: heavy metal response regulator transcription factor [Methylococcaceae bacterium]
MRILIIEDEKKTSAFLSKGLKENGFTVDIAENGVDGLNSLQELVYDLVILDVMMPQMDGWSVLSSLRSKDIQTRILLLTAKDSVEDKVKGLKLGADDYLVKPFAFSELLVRIQTLLRRGAATDIEKIKCADLEIDAIKHRVTRNNTRIDLSPKEFQLLLLMARHPGEVFSRTVIAERVWDINFNSDTNVVDVAIRRLRNKVDSPFENKLIHTIRGVGYTFEQRD